jgi:gamma-glutamyltranspeptidase/glutathione hydrolase
MDTSGERHFGQLRADDLANWNPTIEDPVTLDYENYTVCKTGPWGQGPVMLQQLALLKGFDLEAMGTGSAEWVHTILETSKLAFADREAWYGDPNFTDVPLADLLSADYNDQRRQLVTGTASLHLRAGSPGGRPARLPIYPAAPQGAAATGGVGEPTASFNRESKGDTCHIDVVDSSGMMISATPSGGWFQASPTIPELGFCLSTRGQMFWLEDGLPNSLRPSARPRTTLTPSFALRDGEPWLAFGTPGGDSQDQWSLQFFLNIVHGNMNLQEAIDAPAFHSTHVPSSFYPRDSYPAEVHMENRFSPDIITELENRGHRVVLRDAWSEGRLSAVARDGGWLKAAANPRGNQGYAVGR